MPHAVTASGSKNKLFINLEAFFENCNDAPIVDVTVIR